MHTCCLYACCPGNGVARSCNIHATCTTVNSVLVRTVCFEWDSSDARVLTGLCRPTFGPHASATAAKPKRTMIATCSADLREKVQQRMNPMLATGVFLRSRNISSDIILLHVNGTFAIGNPPSFVTRNWPRRVARLGLGRQRSQLDSAIIAAVPPYTQMLEATRKLTYVGT
jgi:hypothetical protein